MPGTVPGGEIESVPRAVESHPAGLPYKETEAVDAELLGRRPHGIRGGTTKGVVSMLV